MVVKKTVVGLLLAAASWMASAEVNVNSVLGEAAMWLDASSPANFTFDERGGVVTWRNLGAGRATYGDAESYKTVERSLVAAQNTVTNTAVRGSVESIFGAPGLEFGVVGNECDYQYKRITTVRTVFFVGRLDAGVDATYKLAPLLGDKTSCHFHRNDANNSALWRREWADDGDKRNIAMTFYKNSATATCNGETTAPSFTSRDIIIVEAADNVESDCLAMDRKSWQRTAGRGVNELLIFTRVLTAEERTAVYNYLDAKWNQGGWDTGAYETLSAYGGPDKATFAANTAVGAEGDPARRVLTAQYEVAEEATATFNFPVYGGGLTFTGGGKLEFAGGGVFHGKFVQQGGTLNLGGGTLDIRASSRNNDAGGIPQLTGNITWENGTFMPDYWTEFRPQAGANITLAKGAGIYKHTYWRTFLDNGVTLTLAEDAGVSDIGGPLVVTCDSKTDNYLNIHGGTLVVTNANEASTSGIQEYSITIGTQAQAGRGFMDMDGGRVITRRLRVAAGWYNETTGVTSSGTVTLGGGTVELLDCLALGVNSGTRALATVNLNGGEMISPNGILMYNDDQDVLNFNGTAFKATADCAKYFDFRKGSGANVTLDTGGLPFEVAEDKTVTLGWGLKGPGGIAKRGAGTLVLDQDATFIGGVSVQAGTVKAKTVDAMGTGPLSVAAGATVELLPGVKVSLAADCAGAIKVTLSQGGKQPVANVESGFAVANVQLSAYDEIGNLVEGAVFTVESGVLYATVGGDLTATAASTGGTWFGLPWMRDGVAANYPTAAGQVLKATITATGKSQVSMSANATAGKLVMVNGDVNPVFTLSGPNALSANVDLSNYVGEFAVSGMDVLRGVVTMGTTSWFTYIVPAGEEQVLGDSTVTFANSLGVLQKAGAGRLVNVGVMNRSLLVGEGVFTMLIDDPVSTGALNLTGDGLKEKGGTNTLTITGGTFGGPFAVTAGQLTVNGSILGMSSLYIGEGAKVYIPHCNQVNNRLPSNGKVVVDGGELHVCGVNPFSTAVPEIWLTNGMLRVDCSTGSEHIKFKSIHMKDSTFRLQGTKAAYANNGIYYFSNSGQFFLDGECVFEAAAGIPNAIAAEAAVPVNVSAGSSVVWGTPFMTDITKLGPGSVQFADTVDQAKCTATFVMREGVLLTGSKVPRLSLSAGTTVKVLGGEPLTITTALSLPATGTVTVDLSAIDFSTRTEAVRIFTYGQFKESDLAKFAFPALPEDWRVTVGAGLQIVKTTLPKNISWDTGSGEWGDHLWNHDPEGYAAEGYHNVTFKDSTNGVAGATTEIDVSGNRIVTGFTFNAESTPYIFSGAGALTMPSFSGGRVAGFEINVPLTLLTGGITFATTPYNQTIGDIRGTIGAINVPASTGGEAKINFTTSSPRNPGAITIGLGKTLEICANFASGTSVTPTGAVSGDATTKLRVTAKDSVGHMDLTVNNPDFRGKVEVADGGFLHVNSQFNTVIATEQDPVWVHGANSILSLYGQQTNNRFTEGGWALISDGGQFYYRGVNPTKQGNPPSLIVSNGTVRVETVKVGTEAHLHLKNLRFYGDSQMYLDSTVAAYAKEGITIWGDVSVKTGTTHIYQVANHPNNFILKKPNIQVDAGALLRLGGNWKTAPIKAGDGKVELLDELVVPGNAFNVTGGLIVANARANSLLDLTLASGCGFDLTVPESCYAPTNSATLTASGTIRLVTGARELTKGEYLMRWEPGHAPNCMYRLVADQPMGSFFTLERAGDGVRVAIRNFAIFLR